jgi:hypothetical protein
MTRRAVLVPCLLALAMPLFAAQPQFFRFDGTKDFLEGELSSVSVDSDGRMRLAPAARLLHDTEAPFVWCLASDGKGTVYAGTGNEGKVFRIAEGSTTVFFDAPELEVHALAVGKDGRLYVGTSPDGKVYAVEASGKSSTFYDPGEKYIWALALDGSGQLLVATGAEGRVYRVDAKGTATTVLQTAETHVLSVAIDSRGTIYAGSAPSGILYRVDASGKAFVLNDSAYREVKAIDVGSDGSVYAALVEGKPPAETASPRPAPPVPPAIPTASVEVIVTEAGTGIPLGGTSPGGPAPMAAGGAAAKGALVRLAPGGEVDTLWTSAEDTPQSLLVTAEGALLATGGKGKLYRVRNDRSYTLLAVFTTEQLTAVGRRGSEGLVVAASGPGQVFGLDKRPAERGAFVSQPKDTETVSTWGRLRWDGDVPPGTEIQVQTRSGNTQAPDATWTEWSSPYSQKDGQNITSERARFLQLRATLVGKEGVSPVLEGVTTAYLQRNLRPQMLQVVVHPPGEVFQKPISITGDPEVLGLDPPPAQAPGAARNPGMPVATAFSRKMFQRGLQTFSWRSEDANGDTLAYDVYYRAVGDNGFRILRKGLTDAVLAWDTSTVPNGRYLVKVVASDAPTNPAALALTGEKESGPFDVDNTPPVVTAVLAGSPASIRAVGRDDASAIRRAEYSVDGGRWEEVYPLDGINDGLEETYEFAPQGLSGPGPHLVVVRATDLLGNVATARVEVP